MAVSLFKDVPGSCMRKIIKWFVSHKGLLLLFGLLILGILLRLYKVKDFFLYSHDNDLAGWIVKDIVVNHHWRLIGQQTSTTGIFVGPLYYYYLIPFYLLTKMDPIGSAYAVKLIDIFSLFSFYYVFSKLYGKRAGLIALFLNIFSFYMINNSRDVVPTMPVILWTVWFYYGVSLLLKGEKKAYLLLGLLVGLIWHLNITLIIIFPLIPVAVILSKKRINWKYVFLGFVCFVLPTIPLALFELRHHFLQTHSFYLSLVTQQSAVFSLYQRFQRVLDLSSDNLQKIIFPGLPQFPNWLVLGATLLIFAYLSIKKVVGKNVSILITLWLLLYLAFFSIYSKVLSEYYLNGMTIIWFIIATIFLDHLMRSRKWMLKLAVILLIFTFYLNIKDFFSNSVNRSGYIERKEIVAEINQDRLEHSYPCIAISYITDPGYNFGYRYFFWLRGMHVDAPIGGAPVYSIVFPLSKVDRVDKKIGALGLILPDYKRYKPDVIDKSCSGANSNITDSMFGYTE